MRIKIWTSMIQGTLTSGPYKMLDIVESESRCVVGETTHYGEVVLIPPPTKIFSGCICLNESIRRDNDRRVAKTFRGACRHA